MKLSSLEQYKKNESYTYTKEVFFKSDDRFCVFCVILPTNYYPSKFLREKPHFAECINGKVRITWWFKSETKIQFEFKYDQDKANNFQYDDGPNLTEKYPIVKKFEEKIQDVMTDIVAKVLTKSNNE